MAEKETTNTNPPTISWKAVVIFGSNNPFLGITELTDDTHNQLENDLCNNPINVHRFIPTDPRMLDGQNIEDYLRANGVTTTNTIEYGKGYIFACKYGDVSSNIIPTMHDDAGNPIAVAAGAAGFLNPSNP